LTAYAIIIWMNKSKRPRDSNQLTKQIVDINVGDTKNITPNYGKNPAAVALGRLGGLKGGKARAEKLSKERRQEIARIAAQARWRNKDD